MKLVFNDKASEIIQAKTGTLIDNDFLSQIFHDEELLEGTLALFSGRKIFLYPFTEFEFLRDVFMPKIRVFKEEFIAKSIFGHIKQKTHLEVFPKVQENALLLSKIFAHQGHAGKSSFVDLVLAGLLMYLRGKAVLITGNKKDFPSCVFDVLSVMNIEQKDGNMRAFCMIEFNQGKFDSCLTKLERTN